MPDAVVIGAGVAGLAVSIRLALKGYSVRVLEQNDQAGGKLAEISFKGFRFDAGPSLFTMPHYVDELLRLAGKDPRQYFSYEKLDPICRYFYEDGSQLTAWADADRLAEEISLKTADDADSVKRFLIYSRKIYQVTAPVFLDRSLHKWSTYLRWQTVKSALNLPAIDPFRTMDKGVRRFFRDYRSIRFFNRYATYNGSNPYQAPATLNVIPHLENHFGAYFPKGGMYSITRALQKLAGELGVKFQFSEPVQSIRKEGHRVTGVETASGFYPADVLVSNTDVWFSYQLLGEELPKSVKKQERSSSALIFYWGIDRQFPQLDLHNIFFSEDYEAEFKAIWQDKTIGPDPTVYVNISSKKQPSDAPPGQENWFVMINVPSDQGQDWEELISRSRQQVISKLSRMLQVDLSKHLVGEEVLHPKLIQSRSGSFAGSLYGTSSNSRYAAFFRHPNFSSRYTNLFFAGGSVHPGGGIPLALLSARIVDDCISRVH